MATIKIDRLKLITYKGQKKKVLRPICNRYLAKSHIVKCKANNVEFVYANFRGSIFNKVKFENCKIRGCDFWGGLLSITAILVKLKFQIAYLWLVNLQIAIFQIQI